jgi:hypothetical protein
LNHFENLGGGITLEQFYFQVGAGLQFRFADGLQPFPGLLQFPFLKMVQMMFAPLMGAPVQKRTLNPILGGLGEFSMA